MGRGVLIDGGTLRRTTVFALLFGGAIGFLAWRAGGFRARTRPDEAGAADTPATRPGGATPLAPGLGVGGSEDGSLARSAVKSIGGRAVHYRPWTASWAKSTPKKSPDPAVGLQDLVKPRVVLFPEPQSAGAGPVKDGDPGTTRITAATGVLTYEKDVRAEARLDGDVAVDRADPQRGDFRMRTPALVLAMETRGDTESRTARTAAAVAIDGGRAHIQGTGLDADLTGDACRATILRDVRGRFDAAPGSLSMTGGRAEGKTSPTDVTCSGACELVSLGGAGKADARRWRATFHDDVHVVQGADSLDCDLLVVEFRMGEAKSDDGMPAPFVVATGHVHAKGATETRTYDVVCGKATHRREGVIGKEADVVVFEELPVMNVFGPLATAAIKGGRDAPKTPASRGRMEIRCDGAATMTTRKSGNLATSPHRTHVIFEKNVVVKQWDDEKAKEPTGGLRAPKATLYGTRLPTGTFQPDTLTAEGGVELNRLEFSSKSSAATWTRVASEDIDRYMLVGSPVVECVGVRALHPFGKPKTSADSKTVLTSTDNVQIDVYAERPPAAGEPPRPFARLSAAPHVVLVQTEAGVEVLRARSDDEMSAVVAQGKQLEHVEANRNAHVQGLGDDGKWRELSGAKLVLDRLVQPKGAPPDAPHPSQVVALSDATTRATASIDEAGGGRDEVSADSLRYAEQGAVIFATGRVVAVLDRAAKPGAEVSKIAQGPVRITCGEARVDLAPDASGKAGARRLKKIDAGGGVVIDGKIDRIEGRTAVFDAQTGIAEVRGENQTARVVYSAESARYPSLLLADLIRAYVDVSDAADKKGRITRVVCPNGGRIIRYIEAPDPVTGKAVAGSNPRRLQIESKGPMELTRTEADARDDVIARMFSLSKSGDWTDDPVTFYSQKAHLVFDPDAPGRARDRLRTLDAVGDTEHQVVVETGAFFGRADHVELDATAATLKLSTGAGPDVYVRDVATGRQTIYDSVVYHYQTYEWTDQVRMRGIEGKQQDPDNKPVKAQGAARGE